jgi:hypothetical protein
VRRWGGVEGEGRKKRRKKKKEGKERGGAL